MRRAGRRRRRRSCLDLLAGGETDPELVVVLGGPPAPRYLDAPPAQRYWLRVWGARGLLWAPWQRSATDAVAAALGDDAWRVREMAAKVAACHRVDEALSALVALADDPVQRVRFAAARAVRLLTGGAAR